MRWHGLTGRRLAAGRTFYPHGLGHPVGLDVHDPTPSPWFLAPGQVFTVEPGIYFIDMLLEEARASSNSHYYNWELIDYQFKDFGGVRTTCLSAVVRGPGFSKLDVRAFLCICLHRSASRMCWSLPGPATR